MRLARAGALASLLLLGACGSEKFTVQQSVEDLIGDVDGLFGGASLPGKQLTIIRDLHEKKSWVFRAGADEPLERTRKAVRALATCDYGSWGESAIVVEILSSMADEHTSGLVRAEALDTLTRMAPWNFAEAGKPERPTTEAEVIEGMKVLKEALGKADADPAFTFQVALAVTALANHDFEKGDVPAGADNKSAGRAYGSKLRTSRGALRTINGKTLEGFQADPGVREALDRAYVCLSATVIRLTLEKAALVDSSDTTRAAAVRDLGVLAPEGTLPVLRRVLLDDPLASVRLQAARSLASYPVESAAPVLFDGLADEMADVRLAAAHSLESLTGQSLGDDRRAWVKWWSSRAAAPAAVPASPEAGK